MKSDMAVVEPTAAQVVEIPTDKMKAQKLLRRFNYKGLKIHTIEEPRHLGNGLASARIYALTAKKLQPDGEMKRDAITVVFLFNNQKGEVVATDYAGWVVE